MFHENDYVVYKRDVCKIKAIKKDHLNNRDYYVLAPIGDESLIIDVPTDNKSGFIRHLLTKEEIYQMIEKIPDIKIIETNDRMIETEYKMLLSSGKIEDLIRIIKTTYLRNQQRLDNNKKIGDKDKQYFDKAEKYLYNEFGVVLNMSFLEVKEYIMDNVKKRTRIDE